MLKNAGYSYNSDTVFFDASENSKHAFDITGTKEFSKTEIEFPNRLSNVINSGLDYITSLPQTVKTLASSIFGKETKKDDRKPYNNQIIKQKELEERYGYENALCYGTTTINLYRLDSAMTDKQVDEYFSSDEVSKYISKPEAEILSFERLSNLISAFLGNDQYYDYVYPKENGYNIIRYESAEDFKKSSYQYGIGYYYKGTDYSGKPDHYELIVNNPYTVHNPGQKEYNLGWIYPVDKTSIRKDWLK